MVTEAEPENASGVSVAVWMVLSTAGVDGQSAMCAELMVTGRCRTGSKLHAQLAAAQRDVRDLADEAVRTRTGGWLPES
jgi:hypothetical protein